MTFKTTIELEALYDTQRDLQERADHFFDDCDMQHDGDRNYQDLLERISDISEQINEIENGFDEVVEVSPLFKPCGAKSVKKLLRSLGFHHSWGHFIQNGNGRNRVLVKKGCLWVTKASCYYDMKDNIWYNQGKTLGEVQAKLMTYFDIDEIPQIDDKYKQ
jgi:hypothetical protein